MRRNGKSIMNGGLRLYLRCNHYFIQATEEMCALDAIWTTGESMRPARIKHLRKLNRYRRRVMSGRKVRVVR